MVGQMRAAATLNAISATKIAPTIISIRLVFLGQDVIRL